jgi:hypothetical protein
MVGIGRWHRSVSPRTRHQPAEESIRLPLAMSILPLLGAILPYYVCRRSMQAMNAFVHAAVLCDGRGPSIL